MRAIIPTFFVFAFSLSVSAEIKSAAEYQKNCVETRVARCIMTLPQVEPGLEGDRTHCTNEGVQAVYAQTCAEETKTYCDGYSAIMSDGIGGGADIKLPAGCSSSFAQAKPSKPKSQPEKTGAVDLAKAKADLQACTNMKSEAQRCCGNPQSCGGKSTTQDLSKLENIVQDAQQDGDADGLKEVCSQAGKAADANVSLDSSYAGVCAAKHLSCSDACGQVWNSWNKVAAQCSGSSCSELSNLVAQMYQQQSTCTTLTASEQILQDKADQQAINSRISKMCVEGVKSDDRPPTDNTPVAASPSPTDRDLVTRNNSPDPFLNPTQQQQNPPQQMAQAPAPAPLPLGSSECGTVGNIGSCVNCAEHPEFPSCGGGRSSSSVAQGATNESGAPTAKSGAGAGIPNASGMDVGSVGRTRQGPQLAEMQNTVGMIPSSMNLNAQAQAAMAAGIFPPIDPKDVSGSLLARAQMIAAKTGVNTNIFNGERGGGGYHSPSGSGSGFERSSRGNRGLAGGFAIASQATAGQSSYVGMDLKRYLPGGAYGPSRVSGMGIAQSEIGPVSTDMFQRVSLRFKLICVQHGLIDCN